MPSLPEVVSAVCRLPIDFNRANASPIDLLRRSGYLVVRREVTVERLSDRLIRDQELVDSWIAWSEDNRSTPSWYIEALGPREFEVGYYDEDRSSQMRFDDKVRACSEYVHQYLEQVADLATV